VQNCNWAEKNVTRGLRPRRTRNVQGKGGAKSLKVWGYPPTGLTIPEEEKKRDGGILGKRASRKKKSVIFK